MQTNMYLNSNTNDNNNIDVLNGNKSNSSINNNNHNDKYEDRQVCNSKAVEMTLHTCRHCRKGKALARLGQGAHARGQRPCLYIHTEGALMQLSLSIACVQAAVTSPSQLHCLPDEATEVLRKANRPSAKQGVQASKEASACKKLTLGDLMAAGFVLMR